MQGRDDAPLERGGGTSVWETATFSSTVLTSCSEPGRVQPQHCVEWPDSTGLWLWEGAALALVQLLCARPGLCEGRGVLELAAGCGVPSAAAAALGASYVLATDAASATLALSNANILRNEQPQRKKEREELDGGDDAAPAEDPEAAVPPSPQFCGTWGFSGGLLPCPSPLSTAPSSPALPPLAALSLPSLLLPVLPMPAHLTPPPFFEGPTSVNEDREATVLLSCAARLRWCCERDIATVFEHCGGRRFDVVLASDALWLRPYCDDDIFEQSRELLSTALRFMRPSLPLGGGGCPLAAAASSCDPRVASTSRPQPTLKCCSIVIVSTERRLAGMGADLRRAATALGLHSAIVDARGVKSASAADGAYGAPAGGNAGDGVYRSSSFWLEKSDGFFVGSGGGGNVFLALCCQCTPCLASLLERSNLCALSPADELAADALCGARFAYGARFQTHPPSDAVCSVGAVAHRNPLWRRSRERKQES